MIPRFNGLIFTGVCIGLLAVALIVGAINEISAVVAWVWKGLVG